MEKLGVDDPAVIKALGAFGGGIGGTGNICGALVGAVSVLGTMYSRSSLDGKENPRMWNATKIVMKNFQDLTDEYGGINCCQIARVDWMERDQVKDFYGNPESRRQHCVRVVGETARALGELLEQEGAYGRQAGRGREEIIARAARAARCRTRAARSGCPFSWRATPPHAPR